MGSHEVGYFYHYIILDIFSRPVVGWCVADAESARPGPRCRVIVWTASAPKRRRGRG